MLDFHLRCWLSPSCKISCGQLRLEIFHPFNRGLNVLLSNREKHWSLNWLVQLPLPARVKAMPHLYTCHGVCGHRWSFVSFKTFDSSMRCSFPGSPDLRSFVLSSEFSMFSCPTTKALVSELT